MTISVTDAVANAELDAIRTALDAGAGSPTLKVYSGTRPATAGTALSGNTLLGTFNLDSTQSFATAAARAIAIDATPVLTAVGAAAGTATFFRAATVGGVDCFDGSVGTSGADLNLNTTTVSVGLALEITGGSLTIPA